VVLLCELLLWIVLDLPVCLLAAVVVELGKALIGHRELMLIVQHMLPWLELSCVFHDTDAFRDKSHVECFRANNSHLSVEPTPIAWQRLKRCDVSQLLSLSVLGGLLIELVTHLKFTEGVAQRVGSSGRLWPGVLRETSYSE